MLPPTTILKVLTLLSKMMPKAKLFPYKDLSELIFREPGKRKLVGNLICGDHSNKHVLEILNSIPNLLWLILLLQAVYNVISYDDQTRLRTGMELLSATQDIESQLEKVNFLHLLTFCYLDSLISPIL